MRKAANIGGKFGQGSVFASLLLYCMKGKTIKLKLLYGFLYVYWIDHFYTLGSYLGVLLRMPSKYLFYTRCIQESRLAFCLILTHHRKEFFY